MGSALSRILKDALSFLLFAAVLLGVIGLSRPALADPIAEKSPQYAEIIQALADWRQVQLDPQAAGYTAAEVRQRITELQFQRYIQETGEDWGVCHNDTGASLAIYGYDPEIKNATPGLVYLGPGQTTDDDWACTGVFLPADATVTGIDWPEEGAIATLVQGSQLTISTNPTNGALEFNLPVYQILRPGDTSLPWPQLTPAEIGAQPTNAPVS